jgi:hypothetical protein
MMASARAFAVPTSALAVGLPVADPIALEALVHPASAATTASATPGTALRTMLFIGFSVRQPCSRSDNLPDE